MKKLAVVMSVFLIHCSAAPNDAETEGATSSKMVKTISSSYGMTTFGGPGDEQALACGGSSSSVNKWYVASSQRYGCHVHLRLTASNGKCVVVSTEDAGPATFVEKDAGMPILDASPAVAEYLFGESGLGWSDVKAHPSTYRVSAATTSAAVGPCGGADDSSSSVAGFTPAGDDDDADSSGPSTSSPVACGSDGQCNPGNDGAVLICEDGQCIPGCRTDAQCPDNATCVDGQCE